MSQRSHNGDDDIDLGTLFGAMRRALPKVLLFSILAGGLTYLALTMVAPRYTSEAEIAIASKRTNPFPEKQSTTQQPDNVTPRLDREAINTHVKALNAPALLLRVADKLGLERKPEFNAAAGSASRLDGLLRMAGVGKPNPRMSDSDRVLTSVEERLQVAAARETRYISIKFASSEPGLAASFANELAETYRKSLVEIPVKETTDVVQALLPQIEQLNSEVVKAEAELERFRAKTDRLLTGNQQVPLSSQRLGQLSEELSRAESARGTAESRWKTAQGLLRSNSAEVLPEVQQSNTIQGLINQRVRLERQVSEASAALLPAHPRMRQLNADLRGLNRSIRSEVSKVVQSLEKAFRASQIRVDDIARQMSELKAKVVDTSGDDAQIRVLEAQARSKRSELQRLQRQLEDNKTLVATRSVPIEAQIISQARPSAVVTFPKKAPISALVMAATFMLGMMLAAAKTLVSGAPQPKGSRTRHAPQFEDEPDYADAGAAPVGRAAVAGGALAAGTAAVAARSSSRGPTADLRQRMAAAQPVADFRDDDEDDSGEIDDDGANPMLVEIANHLIDRAEDGVGYRTMVVGESSRVNPVEEAVDLASLIASGGHQVVVIDCALDGEGLFDGLDDQPGFSDLVGGRTTFDKVITNLDGSSAHFIGCGAAPDGAGMDPDSANLVLDALDEAYDHIVVVGDFASSRTVFELIQGRFDAGITVSDARRRTSVLEDSENSFLGFEVTDIDVIQFERSENSAFATRRLELGGVEATAQR